MGSGGGAPSDPVVAHTGSEYERTDVADASTFQVSVLVTRREGRVRARFDATDGPDGLALHWGIVKNADDDKGAYVRPDDAMFPSGTDPRPGEPSVQSKFADGIVEIEVAEDACPAGLVFLVFVEGGQWFKRADGGSWFIDLSAALSQDEVIRRKKVEEDRKAELKKQEEEERKRKEEETRKREAIVAKEAALKDVREKEAVAFLDKGVPGSADGAMVMFKERKDNYEQGSFHMRAYLPKASESDGDGDIAAKTESDTSPACILIASSLALEGADVYLHWGTKKGRRGAWVAPPESAWPPATSATSDGKAVQTKLVPKGDSGLCVSQISGLPGGTAGIFVVIHAPNAPDHLKWIQASGGGDIYLPIMPAPPLPGLSKDDQISETCRSMIEGIVEREVEYGSWTLMHRYSHASHLVSSVIDEDSDSWSAMYVWMRYSQIRVLDWQRSYNTQPRQLSHAQLSIVTLLANRYKNMPATRWLTRLVMSCIGRGGSGGLGQRIRDDILVILRHNRGWGHGSMMEQWHQKLHNNTSPDDVIICDALLAFWHSDGDMSKYWNVIYSNGISRERLSSYEQAITQEPDFPGHLKGTMINELNRYGELLKAVHLGTDLNSIVDRCQGFMEGGVRDQVNGFMSTRSSGAVLTDILRAGAHARDNLCKQIVFADNLDDECRRDLIFLDLALESEARRLIESADGLGHDGNLWSHLTAVRAAAHSLKCSEAGLKTEGELERAINEVRAVTDRLGRQGESHDVGLRAAAALNIIRNVLTEIVDRYTTSLGPLSKCMGMAFGADKEVVSTFIEEAVRGGPAFALSNLLRKAAPAVRRVADLGPFSVISPHEKETKGPVVVFDKLRESVGATFKRGTVVVANVCDGDEDVPANTAYVVIGTTVDVLSHVAVRARNEHHGLIACLDGDKLADLRSMHGCIVTAKLTGQDFQVRVMDESGRMSPSVGVQAVMKRVKSSGFITPPSGSQTPRGRGLRRSDSQVLSKADAILAPGGQLLRRVSSNTLRSIQKEKKAISERLLAAPWAIRPSEFNEELVGGKSLNLQRLVALGLPEWILTPVSIAIPNGAMRKVMHDDANESLVSEYESLTAKIRDCKPGDVKLCPRIRETIMSLKAPEGMNEALRGVLDDLGCDEIDEALLGAWEAVKGVWASVWNERAHLARQKLRLSVDEVEMAVLCQKVVDADYAFVIHTSNPLTNDSNEIYAEAVVGLGETLVGNAPGQALGFTVRKDEDIETVTPIVRSYPSKATALIGGKYIFRSDSNYEDLENNAGAGLHDSIPIEKNVEIDVDYAEERLMSDDGFRDFLMRGIAKIGIEVEEIMESPQDIEGCFKDGEFYVVQARPQV